MRALDGDCIDRRDRRQALRAARLHPALRARDSIPPATDPSHSSEEGERSRSREPADDERRADGARLTERSQPNLRADTADARDHRVERDDRRAPLGRNELVKVRLANGARHAEPSGEDEQRRERDVPRVDGARA